MNAVGIDVSKGKSMVAVRRPFNETVAKPFEVRHTGSELKQPQRDGSTCINRTLRMRGWLTDFLSDVLVLGVLRQTNTFPFYQLWQQLRCATPEVNSSSWQTT